MMVHFRARPGLLSEKVDDALIVVNVQEGKVHELNASAAWLWERLSEPKDATEVVELFCEQYDVSIYTAHKDVESILKQMVQCGLLVAE